MMFWIEIGLVLLTTALAFIFPNLGLRGLLKIERAAHWLAARRRLAVVAVGLGALAIRAAVLPVEPIPQPLVHDEFSQLLLADTLARGRLSNPTHPMWVHFETIAVLSRPTYASVMYPAQAVFLAAGKVIAGHPFWGVWLCAGLMCAAICWALQGWMPPGWALLGGSLAIMRLAAFSYWANSYYGGAVPAIGGALVLGALPRIQRRRRVGDALILGLGLGILVCMRPYEGLFLSLPIGVALFAWMLGKKGPSLGLSLRRVVAPTTLVLALALGALGYYCWRVTGSPLRLPYQVAFQSGGSVLFPWQKFPAAEHYHHEAIREYVQGKDVFEQYERARQHPIRLGLWKLVPLWFFFVGPALTLPLVMLIPMAPYGFSLRSVGSKTRLLLVVFFSVYLGVVLIITFLPHYMAAATAALYALILRAMRHLRLWQWHGKPVGRFMVRAVPSICFVMLLLRAATPLPGIPEPPREPFTWCSSHRGNLERARVLAELEAAPGNQLVIVRYNARHRLIDEWVYNEADIDYAKVVWARDMGPAENQELLAYFKGWQVWVVDADDTPAKVSRLAAPG
ncbi:MAG: hypothetical protein ACLQVG_06930 [Terriglobia bacterium]